MNGATVTRSAAAFVLVTSVLFAPQGVSGQDTLSVSCLTLEIEILLSCAKNGDVEAQAELGGRYVLGQGVPLDTAEAVRWYRLAAEQGHAAAQSNLGRMYGTGEGVPEDFVLAYMWYNLAAAQGHDTAQRNKGIIVERMTREQIAEAQKLSREWLEQHR